MNQPLNVGLYMGFRAPHYLQGIHVSLYCDVLDDFISYIDVYQVTVVIVIVTAITAE